MTIRRTITVRMSDAGIHALDTIAARDHEGNRSAALRTVLRLGLAAAADQAPVKQPGKQPGKQEA